MQHADAASAAGPLGRGPAPGFLLAQRLGIQTSGPPQQLRLRSRVDECAFPVATGGPADEWNGQLQIDEGGKGYSGAIGARGGPAHKEEWQQSVVSKWPDKKRGEGAQATSARPPSPPSCPASFPACLPPCLSCTSRDLLPDALMLWCGEHRRSGLWLVGPLPWSCCPALLPGPLCPASTSITVARGQSLAPTHSSTAADHQQAAAAARRGAQVRQAERRAAQGTRQVERGPPPC